MIYQKLVVMKCLALLGLSALLRVDTEKINLLEKIGE